MSVREVFMERKKIADFEYEVDKEGKIYRIGNDKEKYQATNRDGYKVAALYKDNKSTAKTVHRLVALAFLPNPENKPCVNHIDGDKTNNKLENLEWVTYSENTIHSFRNGLQIPAKGEDCPVAKFTNDQIHEICKLMQDGLRNIEIIEKLGVPKTLLKNIRNGTSWESIKSQYDIPKRSRVFSEETVRWICQMFEDGYRICDVVRASDNPKINKVNVKRIKDRKEYVYYSKDYNF